MELLHMMCWRLTSSEYFQKALRYMNDSMTLNKIYFFKDFNLIIIFLKPLTTRLRQAFSLWAEHRISVLQSYFNPNKTNNQLKGSRKMTTIKVSSYNSC